MAFPELKNKIYEVTYSLHGLKSRFDTAEYMGDLEDK